MRTLIVLSFMSLIVASCSTADKKVPQIAEDFCNCFSKMEKEMSAESKRIFKTAANASDPEQVLQDELLKLEGETQTQVNEEFMAFGELEDENSEVGRCMKSVEKKYDNSYTFNESKFMDKVIKELENKLGCDFTASLLKVGKKVEEKEKNK